MRGLPTTFVLDARGEIVYRMVGEWNWDDETLRDLVRLLWPPIAADTFLGAEPKDYNNLNQVFECRDRVANQESGLGCPLIEGMKSLFRETN
ncbi:MAG: hypothetical protein P8179_18940 [Candidatus Thiodiazotropha sp.]|jgi:hypothetical protein